MAKPSSKTQTGGHEQGFGLMAGLFPIDRLLDDNGRNFEALTRMSTTLLDRFAALQHETGRFVAMRLEEDMASQRQFAACRSPAEAIEVYGAFTRKILQDYMDEAGRVSDIAGEMSRACTAFGASLTTTAAATDESDEAEDPAPNAASAAEPPESVEPESVEPEMPELEVSEPEVPAVAAATVPEAPALEVAAVEKTTPKTGARTRSKAGSKATAGKSSEAAD